MEYNREKERLCGVCQRPKDKQTFHSNPIKVGYMYMCKECCTNKYKEALAATGSDGAALWAVCMANDLPLIRKLYEAAVELVNKPTTGAGRKPSLFLTYLALLKEDGKQYRGCFDSDMELSDFVHVGTAKEIADAKKRDADAAEQRKVWAKTWGDGYDDNDYEQLDDYFDGYTADIPEMDAGMVLRYRDLCRAELRKFKGDTSKEVTDEILKLMKLLKIDTFEDGNKSDMDRFIDRLIWKIEEEEPAEEEDEKKYRDIAGFENSFHHIMRSMQNLIAGTKTYPAVPKTEE